jgi:hypothetical protein
LKIEAAEKVRDGLDMQSDKYLSLTQEIEELEAQIVKVNDK